ncbi:uncharacterized protein LOC134232966 [Saccostrea cucullata]|uniref:uncharacterized protein LOC134232966 n=1 Tax=Saccostrea cuccullata TaxID=36930 RepID=UPI002ED084B9
MTTASPMGCNRYGNPCCYNQHSISESKSCKECPPGSMGWNCNMTCPSGFYGRLCQFHCKCLAYNCHHVTGCTKENNFWSQNTTDEKHQMSNFPDWLDKTEEWQTTKTSNLKLFSVFEWSNKTTNMEALITSSMYPAGRQDQNVKQHDVTWLAVSCSLIGSLATLFLIGCFMCFRSRRTLQKKAPKGIKRILFSRLEPDRNVQHHPQEGQLEHSTLIPVEQCQGDDPYTEIRYSQMGGECAEAAMNINNKGNAMSKELKCFARNTYLYEKCSFETEYDHINLKVNSNLPSLHKEERIVCGDLQEYVDLPDEGRLQKEFPNHDGSSKSLTLPLNLKRVSDHNKLKPHFYSLCHDVSTNMLKVDQDKTGIENDCVKQFFPECLQTGSDPEVKEEDRPYSCGHSLLNDDLNPEEKLSTAEVSIILSSVTEDSSPSLDNPYSYVKKL